MTKRLITVVLLAASASPALAQTQPVRVSQEVVVTATASPVPLESAGRTVVVWTAEDLIRLGVSSFADALRLVPGVDVRARGPRDVQTDFSVRGATFGQSLILLDGRRLNDSQSGHHNGDVPATLGGIERIEIVTGPGSAVHGADALGGTINIITRRDAHTFGGFRAGDFGYAAGEFTAQSRPRRATVATSAWGSRSSGFEPGREFAQGGGSITAALPHGWRLDLRHVNKEFGARSFYGSSMSKEWTDQTIAGADWRATRGQWVLAARTFVRNHGDHFMWDRNRPGFAENFHRTNAAEISITAQASFEGGARLAVGTGAGGDRVRSSNLGNHTYGRGHGFVEWQQPVGSRVIATAGARLDRYSRFGTSVSPSAAGVVQLTSNVRLRGSVGRAFRVPTFTELYYHDPGSLGTADLRAERGWSADAGLDWTNDRWTGSVTPFLRRDTNVIDWIRTTPSDFWRATNVRDVRSRGVEVSFARRWRNASFRGFASALEVDAPTLNVQSAYVLEHARASIGLTVSSPIASVVTLSATVDYRSRADGQKYTLIGLKISRAARWFDVFVDASNALNERYNEITRRSPGRWITAGLTIRPTSK